MLKWLFGGRSQPVTIDIREIFSRLDLNHKRFEPSERAHFRVMASFYMLSLRGDHMHGCASAFYTNPSSAIVIKAPPKAFSDEPSYPDERVPNSAGVLYTIESAGWGKRGFGMVITNDFRHLRDYDNAVIFGLYGTYDREGTLTVKRILMPGKDEANRMTPVKDVPVTEENLRKALRYAALCADELYQGRPLYPRTCLDQALRAEQKACPSSDYRL